MSIKDLLLNPGRHCPGTSLGLLAMRVVFGAFLIVGHGWEKLTGFAEMSEGFPGLAGMGGTASLAFVVFAQVFCALAVALGLGTRIAAIPAFVSTLVAALVFHAEDMWISKEPAVLYAVGFLALMLTGAGRCSVDALVCRVRGYDELFRGKRQCESAYGGRGDT